MIVHLAKNPQSIYTKMGTYKVILIATKADGIGSSFTKQITVTSKPTKVDI